MLPELTQQEYATALDAVAADVLCALSIDGPPVDAIELAQAMGLSIAWDATQRGRGRIVRLRRLATRGEQGSILLRPERLQWAIAHEIGETCAHQVFDQLSVDPREAPPVSAKPWPISWPAACCGPPPGSSRMGASRGGICSS